MGVRKFYKIQRFDICEVLPVARLILLGAGNSALNLPGCVSRKVMNMGLLLA